MSILLSSVRVLLLEVTQHLCCGCWLHLLLLPVMCASDL
ncbi:MAG: hypothetical protein ACLRWQ_18320 [Flavonifractor plautii]